MIENPTTYTREYATMDLIWRKCEWSREILERGSPALGVGLSMLGEQ